MIRKQCSLQLSHTTQPAANEERSYPILQGEERKQPGTLCFIFWSYRHIKTS